MTRRNELMQLDRPTLICRQDVDYVLWGDDESGYVNDLFYYLGRDLLLTTICMPPGGSFSRSERHRPIYEADGALYVLEGQYTIQMPESGEIRVAEEGEMILLRGPQWHYGFNFSDRELRLMETIAPLPSPDSVKETTPPSLVRTADVAELSDFPRTRRTHQAQMDVVRLTEASNVLLGRQHPTLLRVMASNDRLSFGVMELMPGHRTDPITWRKDASVYVAEGHAHMRIDAEGEWQELGTDDVFFVPGGTAWQLFNHRGERVKALLSLGGNLAQELATHQPAA
jgi:mannose-6-phosphate isomerase-like protein (cupin superfamily)